MAPAGTRDGTSDGIRKVTEIQALYSALLNHPDERLLLNDIWECREDRELVIEAVKQFNAESSKLLEYEKAPEPRPWQAGYQSERGSNFRELRG